MTDLLSALAAAVDRARAARRERPFTHSDDEAEEPCPEDHP